jgi:REP element-mobilizing transposase RayT
MSTQINKEQAITIMSNILREGCSIPMASIGNGGAGLFFVIPESLNISEFVSYLKGMSFRMVSTSEISEEFGDVDFSGNYDVCVEFSNNDRAYSEQYLLWGLDYYGE